MTSLPPRITALRQHLLEPATEPAITREDQFNALLTAAAREQPRDPLVLGLPAIGAAQPVSRADLVGAFDRLALALGEGAPPSTPGPEPTERRHDA